MYELICGSIFDKKCDVLVVPCNSMGGITDEIRKNLKVNDIHNSPGIKKPGEVLFKESKGSFTNAPIIGFAASVNAFTSKCEIGYLENICNAIRMYCQHNSMFLVNIPLLGTGNGGLSIGESFETIKNYFEQDEIITVRIFVQSQNAYARLGGSSRTQSTIRNPRVFISYTGEDRKNRDWVKQFAYRLRENGVNARIDMFHLKPGYDLPQWMTDELLKADKVLLICDREYAKKADARSGGVGWETMIIQGDVMVNSQTNKYLCIVREKNFDEAVPLYAKTKYFLQWTKPEIEEEDFRQLLYHLFDCDVEPQIGEIPQYIKNKLNDMVNRHP